MLAGDRAPQTKLMKAQKMKKNLSAAIVLASLIVAPSALAQLTFSSFVTDPSLNGAPIGFSYAGNKFVGSLYFNNQLYQTQTS